jgi:peptide/nickel transport system permease protein
MTLTYLWTDILVWALLLSLVIWGRVISRTPQVKEQWRNIFKSSLAMVSSIVLVVYFMLALLDSVHFYKGQNIEMQSLLDMAFEHRIKETERTYSSPFATHEYTTSLVTEEGVSKQVYLPLEHVNKSSIVATSLKALALGLGMSLSFVALHLLWRKRKGRSSEIPWVTAYLTIIAIIMLFTWCYVLSFDYHVLGTDKVGGDVLYQSLKSIRTGVLIGVLTTLVTLPLAIVLGVSAGLFRGWVDDVIQYVYTTLSSIPGVLLIAAGILAMQMIIDKHPTWFESTLERSDLRLLFLVFILGITSWTSLCRLLRAETLKISQVEYVTAAKAFGVSKANIIRRHIIPNLMHIILISIVLDFSMLVLSEAVLSYVGVGVDPTMYSWGNMINQARLEMAQEPMVWWSLFSAFAFMFTLVLAANLFSDRIQSVLDPRNDI